MIKALNYLKNERHLTDDTIRAFHLSYCDAHGHIYTDCDSRLENIKLDKRFNDATIFPIYNLYDELIAVSSRSMQNDPNIPKYVNTVYDKTQHLYGLNLTWRECLKENKVYVVEGNIDTLMMWQHGIKNVVGMLGSNLTFTQICILLRFARNIVLIPDGDKAGAKFLNKLKEVIPSKYADIDLNFSVVTLPNAYDPDKFLYEYGRKEFLQLENNLFYSLRHKLELL
jgi:DNA primase